MIINNKNLSKGEKHILKIKITKLSNGNELYLTAHIITGINEGKTIGLIGGIHGDETHCFEFFKNFIEKINPKELSGNIIILPVANPLAFEYCVRNTPEDNLDLNRNFPGNRDGWLTEKIAYVISEELVKKMDYLIDFHTSPPFLHVEYSVISNKAKEKDIAIKLAKSFGFKYIYNSFGYNGAVTTYANEIGITAIATESGPKDDKDSSYYNKMVDKIENALSSIGFIKKEFEFANEYFIFEEDAYGNIRAPVGGIFIPSEQNTLIGKRVTENDVLFRIYDPYTFDLINETRPCFKEADIFLYRKRSVVKPGDYSFMICDTKKLKKVT
jgi:Predicted deacylase